MQVEGLRKVYSGRPVVENVSLTVGPGEVVGLLGPNGAGKTTTFYMIAGLIPPEAGQVRMGDRNVTRLPMHKRARHGLGYLPQEESIFRKLSVEQNLLAVLETRRDLNRRQRHARCEELLERFGIDGVRGSSALTLSGGEKRRLSIARSLCTEPSLLMLDEPFSGVDPIAVLDIQEIIKQLRNDYGISLLITDHNVRETLQIVDRAYLLLEGRVVLEGPSEQLANDPVARRHYLGENFSL
ncbi:MAG: LPS export ABC transporter ATP-binding protein [Verrucomicrobiota bacterium]|nr:LPS export ABC transporter ATP-binding protein [Verrucomicrobiota bacterium]